MPHDGRSYPFNPEFWVAPAWFWPGFVPWKLHAKNLSPEFAPWDGIPLGWEGVSDAAVIDPAGAFIDYFFPQPVPHDSNTFRVRLSRLGDLPGATARWEIFCTAEGPVFAYAVVDQAYPQRIVFCPTWIDFEGFLGYGSGLGPFLECRPATYAEGGSPYP
jgi:hypothetical protein